MSGRRTYKRPLSQILASNRKLAAKAASPDDIFYCPKCGYGWRLRETKICPGCGLNTETEEQHTEAQTD